MKDKNDLINEVDKILSEKEEIEEKVETNIKKKKINWKLIIFIAVGIIIIRILVAMLTTNMAIEDYILSDDEIAWRDEYNSEYEDQFDSYYDYENYKVMQNFNRLKEKIIINSSIGQNDKINCEIINNNSEDIAGTTLYIVFYDGEDKLVNIVERRIDMVCANSNYYCTLDTDLLRKDYERYEVLLINSYTTNYLYNKLMDSKDVEYTSKEDDGRVIINYKNNSNNEIGTIEFATVYYNKNKEIVAINNSYDFNVKSKAKSSNIYSYIDYDIEYDSYEVFINYVIKSN